MILHSDTQWNEVIKALNILRSISHIHALIYFDSLVDTQDSNEMLPQKIEVDPSWKIKILAFEHPKAGFQKF